VAVTDPHVDDDANVHRLQFAAMDLVDAFAEHDRAALARMTADQLAEQLAARRAFYDYVDEIWEAPKRAGASPANDPRFDVVAGLRDLADALVAQADEAFAHMSGDPHRAARLAEGLDRPKNVDD
jgi:hypothetical protein